MKSFKKIFFILLPASILVSCDIITGPFVEENIYQSNGRKILIEDYTGQRCGNCPKAHEELQRIVENYKGDVIPLSVHAGFYAMPIAGFTADYRTPEGNELDAFYQVSASGLPKGMVNRKDFEGNKLLTYSQWRKAASTFLSVKPDLKIDISAQYANRNANIEISATFVKSFSQPLALSVYLSQDSVFSPQADYDHDPVNIPNYCHRYIFRKAVTPVFGELLAQTVDNGVIIRKNYITQIDSTINPQYCYIIAFVSFDESKEIIQAEMIRLIHYN